MSPPQFYGYPLVGRTGLGNMLFPCARCYLWCREYGAAMIAPFWTRLRIGPYLRHERDKRHYHRLFHSEGYVAGLKRFVCLLSLKRVQETAVLSVPPEMLHGAVVVFKGMDGYFQALRGKHREIRLELLRITRSEFRNVDRVERSYIGIHVRRGDFASPGTEEELLQGQVHLRLPIDWYVQALRALRASLSSSVEATVFTDGTPAELALLLKEPGVALSRNPSPISDMLELASSGAIIASGSTFSMWASYLGQVPAIWYPGQLRQRVIESDSSWELEPEWKSGTQFPARFLRTVELRLRHTVIPPREDGTKQCNDPFSRV